MGRSQRHKVYIQGFASDDSIMAEGLLAGTEGANLPPAALMEKPQPNQGQSINPPPIGGIDPPVIPLLEDNRDTDPDLPPRP